MIKLWQIIILVTLPIIGMIGIRQIAPFPYGLIASIVTFGFILYIGEKYVHKYINHKRENRFRAG